MASLVCHFAAHDFRFQNQLAAPKVKALWFNIRQQDEQLEVACNFLTTFDHSCF
jgi:hypothetical protein